MLGLCADNSKAVLMLSSVHHNASKSGLWEKNGTFFAKVGFQAVGGDTQMGWSNSNEHPSLCKNLSQI